MATRAIKVKPTRARIGSRTFAFQRRTYVPAPKKDTPLMDRASMASRVVAAIFSPEEATNEKSEKEAIGIRERQALNEAWRAGKEASRVLERRASQYFANPKRAEEMSLHFWMDNFRWFLEIPSIRNTPARKQKERIILRAEEAILSFSRRCVSKAVQLQYSPIRSRDAERKKLMGICLFLKQLYGSLSEQGNDILQKDINSIDAVTGPDVELSQNLGKETA